MAEADEDGEQSAAEFRLSLAAVYLEDAISHRHIQFAPTIKGIRLYQLYKVPFFQYLLYALLLTYVSLALVEAPARPGWLWPLWVTLSIELLCVAFFVLRMIHELLLSASPKVFWLDTKHLMNAFICFLTIMDICIYVGMRESSGGAGVRISRPLRALVIVNFPEARQIRRAFRTIRKTCPALVNVLVLFASSLAIFALMAVKLFGKQPGFLIYFDGYWDAFWHLYVLVTTANSPDVMMPAYDSHRASVLFFVVFLLVNLYLFMRVFLAVIYNSYKENLSQEVSQAMELKRKLLTEAFDLLKNEEARIEREAFLSLMKAAMPSKATSEYLEVCWLVLDPDNQGSIGVEEFASIVDLVSLRVVDTRARRKLWWPRRIHQHPASKRLIKIVRHVCFRYAFDFLIFLNALFIAFDFEGGEPFFLAAFTLEILLKLYAFGLAAFSRKLWNLFDVVVVGSALLVTAFDLSIDVLMVLRVIRIFKIFHTLNRFRGVINAIMHILPSMAAYMGVLLAFYYFFAMVGMELFAGKITYFGGYNETSQASHEKFCGSAKLEHSEFYRQKYCSNNFNDVLAALVTLFELMAVNQWHVIAEGFVIVTESKAVRIYFLLFHFVCVTVVLNIFSAFVIEAFILEFSVTTSCIGKQLPRRKTPLAVRISAMGLGYSKAKLVEEKCDATAGGDEDELIIIDDDDLVTDDMEDQDAKLDEVETNVPDYSSRTGLRFHLASRTRTAMGLLETMFAEQNK